MNIAEHIEFDQLTTQAKCLLTIAAMGANLRTGDRRRLSEEALVSVARSFLNNSCLAPAELGNLIGIADRLCKYHNSTRTLRN
jgi:hypothetical protein